jgi:hypothetical protein
MKKYEVYTYVLDYSEHGYLSQPIAYLRKQTDSPDLLIMEIEAESGEKAKLEAIKQRRRMLRKEDAK